MRYSQLFESNIKDIFNDNFQQFLLDYNDIYDKNLFIVFTDNNGLKFEDEHNFNEIPKGMIVYPLSHVVRNPETYTEYARSYFLYVIELKGNILSTNNIRYSHVEKLGNHLKLDREVLDNFIKSVEKSYKSKKELFYAYTFNMLLWSEIKNGEIKNKYISESYASNRLRGINIDAYVDFSRKPSDSIITQSYPSIGVVIKPNTYTEKDKYDLVKTNELEKGEKAGKDAQYLRDKYVVKELAEAVAHSINTRLNNDEPYVIFLDYYYWTVEGIQIMITVAFSNDMGVGSDQIYYVVKLKTPFGTLIHTSNTNDSFKHIGRDVKTIYQNMIVPDSDWNPMNRDIFMMGQRKETKIIDEYRKEIIDTVDMYYSSMREYGRSLGIIMPVLSYFSNYDKLFINDLIEMFMNRPEPRMTPVIENLIENDFNFNNLLFRSLPERITITLIKKIAQTYDIAIKKFPSRQVLYIFKDM